MKVYHYTAISYLKSIEQTGIHCGEVATNPLGGVPGVSLTTDPEPSGHGLGSCNFLTPKEIQSIGYYMGSSQSVPIWPNKRKVRLSLDLPRPMLVNWMRWAKRNITPVFRDALIQGGGGMAKARTWLISWDELPVESITEVEVEQMGKWVAVEEYSGPWFETFSDRALLKGYRHWGDRLAVGLSDELFERAKLLNAQVHGLQHSTHRTAEVHGSMLAA